METFFKKYTLTVYWIFILLDCIFLYFDLPFIYITEPFLIPLLILYLYLHDENIGKPAGKFIFYIGLFFSFFGDLLQLIVTHGLLFMTTLVTFMIMNLCYTVSFFSLNKGKMTRPILLLVAFIVFVLMGYAFIELMGNELDIYQIPVIVNIATVILLATTIVNLTGNPKFSMVAYRYFIPATVMLIFQNIAYTVNLFHFNGQSRGFIYSLVSYALFDFLMVKGVLKAYITPLNAENK